jgi:hypothetical protein
MADALALPPKLLQQDGVFGPIRLFKLHPNPFRQCRAVPAGRDGDLQGATTDDGGSNEVAGIRRIDNIDPDVPFPCSLAHRPIHRRLIGSADDQRTPQDIVAAKRSRLVHNDGLCREVG